MPKFYVTNESTEDTFGATDDLEEAIRIAKDVATKGPPGDLVLVESSDGRGVKQFTRTEEGAIAEREVA